MTLPKLKTDYFELLNKYVKRLGELFTDPKPDSMEWSGKLFDTIADLQQELEKRGVNTDAPTPRLRPGPIQEAYDVADVTVLHPQIAEAIAKLKGDGYSKVAEFYYKHERGQHCGTVLAFSHMSALQLMEIIHGYVCNILEDLQEVTPDKPHAFVGYYGSNCAVCRNPESDTIHRYESAHDGQARAKSAVKDNSIN